MWGLTKANFRYDLMGQAHEMLPRDDGTYMKKAGKYEEGTFCAVPIVESEWTIDSAIPFWLICENDWRGWRDCRAAMEGTYVQKDWYGSRELEDCLNAPLNVRRCKLKRVESLTPVLKAPDFGAWI